MIPEDPVWWETFEYKLTLLAVIVSWLISIVVGIWKLSRRYTEIIHRLGEKVSHSELKAFKTEILDHVEKSSDRIKADMAQDKKENRGDHKDILVSLGELNRLFVTHIDRMVNK